MRSRTSGFILLLVVVEPLINGSAGSTTAPTAKGPASGRAHLVETYDHAVAAPCSQRALETRTTMPVAAVPPPRPPTRPSPLHGVVHALARVGHERALEHRELALVGFVQALA